MKENENIPPEAEKYWKEYVKRKPVANEVNAYVTELVASYAAGKITESYFMNELNSLKQYGLTDEEITFIKKRADLRRARTLKA